MKSFALDFKTSGSSNEGSIEIGGVDHTKYAGQLATAPLNHTDGHWSVDKVDFSVGNKRINTDSNVVLGTYRSLHSSYFIALIPPFRPPKTQAQDTTSSSPHRSRKPTTAESPGRISMIVSTAISQYGMWISNRLTLEQSSSLLGPSFAPADTYPNPSRSQSPGPQQFPTPHNKNKAGP